MKVKILTAACALAAATAWAAPGDIIGSFHLAGTPGNGVRGLDKDWADGNIWVAGPDFFYCATLAKFDAQTHSILVPWTKLYPETSWCNDLGYGFVYNGNRVVVVTDISGPDLKMWTTTGSYCGGFPTQMPIDDPLGFGCDWGGTLCFGTPYDSQTIYRWDGTKWGTWTTSPGRATYYAGVGVGWNRVFAVTSEPDYKIYEWQNLNSNTGSLTRSFPLKDWPAGRYVIGLGIGRPDALGNEESVFLASQQNPEGYVFEVSVGDVSGAGVAPSSLGRVKALFR